jgi:hypothetical protein
MKGAALVLAIFTLLGAPAVAEQNPIETLIHTAVNATGSAYFEAEHALRSATAGTNPAQLPSLDADPVADLILEVLQQWRQAEGVEFARALDYLDTLPARLALTPITRPSPSGIASYLSLHFGPRVANLLAVHLIKQTDWPYWRTSGVLLYLRQQTGPSITPALIRFVGQTQDKEWLASVMASIRAANDPALRHRILAEERFATRRGLGMPAALRALAAEE